MVPHYSKVHHTNPLSVLHHGAQIPWSRGLCWSVTTSLALWRSSALVLWLMHSSVSFLAGHEHPKLRGHKDHGPSLSSQLRFIHSRLASKQTAVRSAPGLLHPNQQVVFNSWLQPGSSSALLPDQPATELSLLLASPISPPTRGQLEATHPPLPLPCPDQFSFHPHLDPGGPGSWAM